MMLAAIAGLALVSSCDFGGDDEVGGDDSVTVKSDALLSDCTVRVYSPTRTWVGSGDGGHYALVGSGSVLCQSAHNLSATMTVYKDYSYYDSRSTTRWGSWGFNFNAYLACPAQGSIVYLGFTVQDLNTGAATTVYTNAQFWYPGC
jgi:hypothetical protein